jgi:hypothetical protein
VNSVIGALRISLGLDSAAFEGGLTGAQRTMKRFERDMTKLSANLQGIGGMLTLGLTAPLAAVGGAMAKLAIDAEEMNSAFAVSFGNMAKETEAWAVTTGDALGRSTQEMQKGALAFNGLFKAGGPATAQAAAMSKQFAILAQDLSSFYNVSPDVALQSLISGLSGEAEPLRKFNVFLTESAVRLKAVELGLGTMKGELSESAKIQARAALILKATTEAQGDVERTAGSTANQIRRLQSEWQELAVTLGNVLTPLIRPIVTGLADMVKGFGTLSPEMQKFALIGAGVAAAIGPILIGAGALVSALGTLAGAFAATGGAVALMTGPIGLAVTAVAALTLGLGYYLQANSQAGIAATANRQAHEKLDPILKTVRESMALAAGASGALRDQHLRTADAAFRAGEAELESARKTLAAAKARLAATQTNEDALMKMGVGGMPGYMSGMEDLRVSKAAAALKAAEDALISGGFGRRRPRGQGFAVIRPSDAANEATAITGLTGSVTALGSAADKSGAAAAKATKPVRDFAAELKTLNESLMGPGERAAYDQAQQFKLLSDALEAGKINAEGLARALRQIDANAERANFAGTVKTSPDQNPQLVDMNLPTATFGGAIMSDEAAKALREQMAGTFRGALDSLKNGGTKGLFQWMADQLSDRLMDSLADTLTSLMDQLLKAMSSSSSSSGGGDIWATLGSAFVSMFGGGTTSATTGFATGGSFTVGGSGGIDSQLMQFRATPGEMVNIRHGNDNGGGGAVVFDMRGAVVTEDLLQQMNSISLRHSGAVYGQVKSEQAQAMKAQKYRVAR